MSSGKIGQKNSSLGNCKKKIKFWKTPKYIEKIEKLKDVIFFYQKYNK
jgi:hypothetical protein